MSHHVSATAVPLSEGQSWLRDLLSAFKRGLERLYGDHLEGLYLFGSHARGEATEASDVDLAIVLDLTTDQNWQSSTSGRAGHGLSI